MTSTPASALPPAGSYIFAKEKHYPMYHVYEVNPDGLSASLRLVFSADYDLLHPVVTTDADGLHVWEGDYDGCDGIGHASTSVTRMETYYGFEKEYVPFISSSSQNSQLLIQTSECQIYLDTTLDQSVPVSSATLLFTLEDGGRVVGMGRDSHGGTGAATGDGFFWHERQTRTLPSQTIHSDLLAQVRLSDRVWMSRTGLTGSFVIRGVLDVFVSALFQRRFWILAITQEVGAPSSELSVLEGSIQTDGELHWVHRESLPHKPSESARFVGEENAGNGPTGNLGPAVLFSVEGALYEVTYNETVAKTGRSQVTLLMADGDSKPVLQFLTKTKLDRFPFILMPPADRAVVSPSMANARSRIKALLQAGNATLPLWSDWVKSWEAWQKSGGAQFLSGPAVPNPVSAGLVVGFLNSGEAATLASTIRGYQPSVDALLNLGIEMGGQVTCKTLLAKYSQADLMAAIEAKPKP